MNEFRWILELTVMLTFSKVTIAGEFGAKDKNSLIRLPN
jgi:hypothetical protein